MIKMRKISEIKILQFFVNDSHKNIPFKNKNREKGYFFKD